MPRPTKDTVFLQFAFLLAQRSTCQRAKVGCVITDSEGLQVLGIGYNGNARGFANCCDDREAVGHCGCLHAELNALLKAPGTVSGKVMYLTMAPCVMCAKAIVNSGVARVVYCQGYRNVLGLDVLTKSGISFEELNPSKVKITPKEALEKFGFCLEHDKWSKNNKGQHSHHAFGFSDSPRGDFCFWCGRHKNDLEGPPLRVPEVEEYTEETWEEEISNSTKG